MSKCTILAHLGNAQYSVEVKTDTAKIQLQINKLDALILALTLTDIPAAIVAQTDALAAQNTAISEQDTAINNYNAGSITEAQLRTAQRNVLIKAQAYQDATRALNLLNARKLSASRKKDFLTAHLTSRTRTVNAWCADRTTTLTGDVGAIDINNDAEFTGEVILRPAIATSAAYSVTRDGMIHSPQGQTPEGVFVNWAKRPGWQKWKPGYRLATITSINTTLNTCSLTFHVAISVPNDQVLRINQSASADNVPIVYATCNAAAFQVGDQVVVEFQSRDWGQPRVIGFRDNPRACEYRIRIKDYAGVVVTPSYIQEKGEAIGNIPAPTTGETNTAFVVFRKYLPTTPYNTTGVHHWSKNASAVETFTGLSFDTATNEWVFASDPSNPSLLIEVRIKQSPWTVYPDKYLIADKFSTGTPITPGSYEITLPLFYTSQRTSSAVAAFPFGTTGTERQIHIKASVGYRLYTAVDDLAVGCNNDEDDAVGNVDYSNSPGTISVTRPFGAGQTYSCIEQFDTRTANTAGVLEYIRADGDSTITLPNQTVIFATHYTTVGGTPGPTDQLFNSSDTAITA